MKNNISILPILFIFFSSCIQKSSLVIIDVSSSGMGFQPDRKMVTLRASARIIFYNDIEIYIEPEHHLKLEYIKNSAGEDVEERVKSIDTLHKVFVKKSKQKLGIEYDLERMKDLKGIAFNADSLWATLTFYKKTNGDFGDIGKPIKIIEKGDIKIYQYALKFQLGGVDSVYRYYDKSIKGIPYKLSEKLDTLKTGKLFKISAIANEIPKGVYLPDMAVPRREYYHEMTLVKDTSNIKLYREIIERFKRDSKRLNLK